MQQRLFKDIWHNEVEQETKNENMKIRNEDNAECAGAKPKQFNFVIAIKATS